MIKQIINLTSKQVKVRAHMLPQDLSTDIPTYDQLEEFAREAFGQRFGHIDTNDWDGFFELRGAFKRQYPTSWGAVDFTLTA